MKPDPITLLADLRSRGVRLSIDAEGRLMVGPASMLDDADREAIAACKPALYALVESEGLYLDHAHSGERRGFSDWKRGNQP